MMYMTCCLSSSPAYLCQPIGNNWIPFDLHCYIDRLTFSPKVPRKIIGKFHAIAKREIGYGPLSQGSVQGSASVTLRSQWPETIALFESGMKHDDSESELVLRGGLGPEKSYKRNELLLEASCFSTAKEVLRCVVWTNESFCAHMYLVLNDSAF